jgi:hypothetical protein
MLPPRVSGTSSEAKIHVIGYASVVVNIAYELERLSGVESR